METRVMIKLEPFADVDPLDGGEVGLNSQTEITNREDEEMD